MSIKLILLRHGESIWNQENRFTGWTDVDLSAKGIEEARRSGRLLKEHGFVLEVAHVSVLKRAIRTLWLVLEEMDQMWLPVCKSWRLNERHYGALQGLNKAETASKYGDDQVHIWRRSFDVRPPALEHSDPRHPGFDPRYTSIDKKYLPATESLQDTEERFQPYWDQDILPQLRAGKKILIAAHGNTLRAVVMLLEKLTPEQIMQVEIPTGRPLIYELSDSLAVIKKHYLINNKESSL